MVGLVCCISDGPIVIVIRSRMLMSSSTTERVHGRLRRRRSSACLRVSLKHSRSDVFTNNCFGE